MNGDVPFCMFSAEFGDKNIESDFCHPIFDYFES